MISKLDYIQAMGFDAIWISPTALNIEGSTKYGEAYHVSFRRAYPLASPGNQ